MGGTLFLNPPSFAGFDGGAGSRYQARREVTSFWYPTWLAQPAALVPESKLLDCPPHDIGIEQCLQEAKGFDHVIIHTSTPSLKNDCRVAEAIKQNRPETKIGFVGAHAAVLPTETLKASWAIDWVGRREFDFTCREVAEGRPLQTIAGLSYRDPAGQVRHNPERELIQNMDCLPWVADVYKRDLQIERYFIGYLLHPYVSLYTGRGCPGQCTFCLWPQTIGGHKYRARSPENVAAEMAYLKELFPQAREFFFDDDTFTANLPRAREVARRLAPLGLTWSCSSRANLDYDTIKSFQDCGLRLFLVGYESGHPDILSRLKKGVTLEEMRRFTRACHQAGVVIHGTFVLGLPIETKATIEASIRFAKELDVFSLQVSLAAPYPGTELYEMARQHGWFVKKDKTDLVEEDGFQQSALEYPDLSKEEIFEAVDRFYRAYYLRPKPILRIIKTMLEDKAVFVRRCREGYEFFKSLRQRKADLAAARAAEASAHPAPRGPPAATGSGDARQRRRARDESGETTP
ncbi:MAG: hopanoid biosynthesis associated radical SAM protein HpnJ [Verrucomicrobiota bacterium]|jgi:hopanoid biosynthesis associated radical SAM protein HpnJ